MMRSIFILLTICFSCNSEPSHRIHQSEGPKAKEYKNINDIAVPDGYERVSYERSDFGTYLRSLPLKKVGTPVKYYNGQTKSNNVHFAVVNLPIGNKDLHQCADATMRLRADYLRAIDKEDDISFNFTNGFACTYKRWKNGERIKVDGNNTQWVKKYDPNDGDDVYWQYLEQVFMFAGTYSLDEELDHVPLSDLQSGDIFIQGGFPGHAIIIMDMAVHMQTGKKIMLLGQSYMPAQETHVLINQHNEVSPWYIVGEGAKLRTPEWTFEWNDAKRF